MIKLVKTEKIKWELVSEEIRFALTVFKTTLSKITNQINKHK